jgi:hypothetical protein
MSDEQSVAEIAATIDSSVYQHRFYGILNADGEFWTPLAFESEGAAQRHIRDFWCDNIIARERCLNTFQIVPVRIQLTHLKDTPNVS